MFDLFVTCVKKEHGLVKIFGQTDVSTGRGVPLLAVGKKSVG
jgi:hypothetical protein